jgi:hypothetical protein
MPFAGPDHHTGVSYVVAQPGGVCQPIILIAEPDEHRTPDICQVE